MRSFRELVDFCRKHELDFNVKFYRRENKGVFDLWDVSISKDELFLDDSSSSLNSSCLVVKDKYRKHKRYNGIKNNG